MYSDQERARHTWEQVKQDLEQLAEAEPETLEDAQRHEAMLHLARLRAYIAVGRVIALGRSSLAHKACEEAPISLLYKTQRSR
ncbi:hypothetical protein [Methylobacterium nigriterrae]|uniref:hypothetical protein n=1 Tax=Methylobacterium nigriterrae TaxID=3127512 RepID=UPI0030140381